MQPVTAEAVAVDLDHRDEKAVRGAVALLAASVPDVCEGLVAYHATGYAAFLTTALAPPPTMRTVLLRAVIVDTAVAAVADWRLLDDVLFLNGIAVRATNRNQGHGSRLLDDGVRLAGHLAMSALELDVSQDNPGAEALYLRAGFTGVSQAWWSDVRADETPGKDADVRLLDWPLFTAHHQAYGFGDLTVRHPAHPAGRLRLVGAALRVPDGPVGTRLAGALTDVLRPTRVFTIRSTATATADGAFAAFTRMRLPLR
ncbi:GNAT family N-acetyltransferase [Micromonospora sp. NPDC005707]|uniref:GNAT family N-acetyltransferase n=1 Tax=Micromonospora sp. NPDC005707 TaxID=3157050 RepID=UPI0033F5AF34